MDDNKRPQLTILDLCLIMFKKILADKTIDTVKGKLCCINTQYLADADASWSDLHHWLLQDFHRRQPDVGS